MASPVGRAPLSFRRVPLFARCPLFRRSIFLRLPSLNFQGLTGSSAECVTLRESEERHRARVQKLARAIKQAVGKRLRKGLSAGRGNGK